MGSDRAAGKGELRLAWFLLGFVVSGFVRAGGQALMLRQKLRADMVQREAVIAEIDQQVRAGTPLAEREAEGVATEEDT